MSLRNTYMVNGEPVEIIDPKRVSREPEACEECGGGCSDRYGCMQRFRTRSECYEGHHGDE